MKIRKVKTYYHRSTTYKGVVYKDEGMKTRWFAHTRDNHLECPSEREAAIQYDKWRIKAGKPPVNILKKVNKPKTIKSVH